MDAFRQARKVNKLTLQAAKKSLSYFEYLQFRPLYEMNAWALGDKVVPGHMNRYRRVVKKLLQDHRDEVFVMNLSLAKLLGALLSMSEEKIEAYAESIMKEWEDFVEGGPMLTGKAFVEFLGDAAEKAIEGHTSGTHGNVSSPDGTEGIFSSN